MERIGVFTGSWWVLLTNYMGCERKTHWYDSEGSIWWRRSRFEEGSKSCVWPWLHIPTLRGYHHLNFVLIILWLFFIVFTTCIWPYSIWWLIFYGFEILISGIVLYFFPLVISYFTHSLGSSPGELLIVNLHRCVTSSSEHNTIYPTAYWCKTLFVFHQDFVTLKHTVVDIFCFSLGHLRRIDVSQGECV